MILIPNRRLRYCGNDIYTKLLLHFNGPKYSTTILDSSSSNHTVTAGTGMALYDTYYVFGGTSLGFYGLGGEATIPDHDDFELGSGDFTIDLRWRSHTMPVNGGTPHYFVFKGGSYSFYLWNNAGTLQYVIASEIGPILQANTYISIDSWHHVEFARSGTTWYIFQDGTLLGSTSYSKTFVNNSNGLSIGYHSTEIGGSYFDELRLSKGIARHVAEFTMQQTEYR